MTHHVPTKRPEHLRSGTLDDGSAGEESCPQVERQYRLVGYAIIWSASSLFSFSFSSSGAFNLIGEFSVREVVGRDLVQQGSGPKCVACFHYSGSSWMMQVAISNDVI